MVLTKRALVAALALVPLGRPRPARSQDMRRYRCAADDCAPYVYHPRFGDQSQGIPPGTAFEDLPDDWYCPLCGAGKSEFRPVPA